MKKFLALVLVLCLLPLASCAKRDEQTELVVFAAASLTETLQEISEQYREVSSNVTILFNFDSSGTLKTQIESGAPCDLFVSAGQKQMDELAALSLVETDSRIDLLENKVALCVPEGNPAGLTSFDDLAEKLADASVLLAMGNADVPVGQYTQKIFAYYALDENALAASGCLTYGSNVKEVTTHIKEAAADCGVIYQTDACSAGLPVVDTATEQMCGRVVYPAAVLTGAQQKNAAHDFLAFLQTEDAAEIFASVGFTPLG